MTLPEFKMGMYDVIGLKLVKIRALPKCEEKGEIYVRRMCRDRKIQWVNDFSQQRNHSYNDSYKRKNPSVTLHNVLKEDCVRHRKDTL